MEPVPPHTGLHPSLMQCSALCTHPGCWYGTGVTPRRQGVTLLGHQDEHVHWLCPQLQAAGRLQSPAGWDGCHFPVCSIVLRLFGNILCVGGWQDMAVVVAAKAPPAPLE